MKSKWRYAEGRQHLRDSFAGNRGTGAANCSCPSSSTGWSRGGIPEPISSLLLHSNEDLPVLEGVEPALHQEGPLDPKGSEEEIESHSSKSITLEEHHEEAKAHKDHHMNILEGCAERRDHQLCGEGRDASAV